MPPLLPSAGPPPSLSPIVSSDDGLPPRDSVHVKVVSVGNSCCGKSCLIKRYCEKKFIPKYITTIGLDFGVRHTPNPQPPHTTPPTPTPTAARPLTLKLNFFDLSGAGYYGGVRREFYGGCQLLLLCFDVNVRASYAALGGWLAEAREGGGLGEGVVVCVCGCMSGEEGLVDDAEGGGGMSSGRKRAVSEAEARVWSESRGYLYYELSAKTGKSVEEMFDAALQALSKQLKLM